MDKIATDNLFLIEFLVDTVQLDPNLTQDIGDVMGNTCVTVQFLDNTPLDICEDDFNPKREYKKETDSLKSGKSCLFSLTPAQAREGSKQFDVFVDIFKKTREGVLPDKIQVGSTLVSIVNLFTELIQSLSSTSPGSNPTAKTLKDTFRITNASGAFIGNIALYIRMSCFGKLIVTQFQMNLDDKSVLFKDKEGHSLYRYKKSSSRNQDTPSGRRGSNGSNSNNGNNGGDKPSGEYDDNCEPSCPNVPCPQPTRMSAGYGARGGYPAKGYDGPCAAACPTVSCDESPDINYQQINGQAGDDDDSCACTAGNMGKGKKKSKASYGRESNNQVPAVNFEMPDAAQAPYSFTLGGCGFASQNPNAAPNAENSCTPLTPKRVSDANHDVFILKVSEKKEFKPKKQNIELEMTTPKGPVIKPRPRKETRFAQCEPEGKGKKGKKGGKGKKGKKGKK